MAPEQAAGRKDLTVAADEYSLGVILYERLTGQTPFTGDNALTLLRQARESAPPRPSSIRPGLDRDLETVIVKSLDKEPSRRYASAEGLADDLSNWLAGRPITARRVGQAERAWQWCKRNPAVAILFGAVAASILMGTLISTMFGIWAMSNATRANRAAAAERKESQRANEAARKAIEEKESSNRLRYVAEINAAVRDYQAGKLGRVRNRLASLTPSRPNEIDLRGLEWYRRQWLLNQSLKVFAMPSADAGPIAFSRDGRRLVVGAGSAVYEWDSVEEKKLAELKISGGIESADYGPSGVIIVNHAPFGEVRPELGDNGTIIVRLWEPKSGRDTVIVHTDAGHSAAVSCDGRRAALIAGNREVKVLELDTGRVVARLHGDLGPCTGYALSSSGSRFAFMKNDNLCVWDTESNPVATIDRIDPMIRGEASLTGHNWESKFSSDGRLVAVWVRGRESNIRIWDIVQRRVIIQLPGVGIRLATLAFSMDCRRIATGCDDGTVRIWNVETGRQLASLRGHEGSVNAVIFSPDGRRIASGGRDGTVRIWDTETFFSRTAFQGSDYEGWVGAFNFALHPDGLRVVLPDRIMDVRTGRLLARIPAGAGEERHGTRVSLSLDGRLMATAHAGIWLWDLATVREIAAMRPPKEDSLIQDITFSPDGRFLALGKLGARSCGSGTPGTDMRSHNSVVMRTASATSTSVPTAAAWHQPPGTVRFGSGNCRLAE